MISTGVQLLCADKYHHDIAYYFALHLVCVFKSYALFDLLDDFLHIICLNEISI